MGFHPAGHFRPGPWHLRTACRPVATKSSRCTACCNPGAPRRGRLTWPPKVRVDNPSVIRHGWLENPRGTLNGKSGFQVPRWMEGMPCQIVGWGHSRAQRWLCELSGSVNLELFWDRMDHNLIGGDWNMNFIFPYISGNWKMVNSG